MEAINLFNGCDYTDIFFLGPPDLYNDYNSTYAGEARIIGCSIIQSTW